MSRASARAIYSYAEYRRFEEATDAKHEFFDGDILAMAGGTPEHAALAAAIISALSGFMAGKSCSVFSSDLRVRVRTTGLATYPDATVVCGEIQRDPEDENAVTNPVVLVEVLSESTAAYDAGDKFEHYRQIPALRAYLLVSQDQRRIELRSRDDDGTWHNRIAGSGECLYLEAIAMELVVDAIYERSPLTASL